MDAGLAVAVTDTTGGSVSVAVTVAVQPEASVMVTTYTPADSPVEISVVDPEGDQAYVYVGVPPVASTSIDPSAD